MKRSVRIVRKKLDDKFKRGKKEFLDENPNATVEKGVKGNTYKH